MKKSFMFFWLCAALALNALGGVSGCGNGQKAEVSPEEDIDAWWGIDDEIGPKLEYVRKESRINNVLEVKREDNKIMLSNSYKSLTAESANGGQTFNFSETHRGMPIECAFSPSDLNKIKMNCTINGSGCVYSIEKKDGDYVAAEDSCTDLLKGKVAEKTNTQKSEGTNHKKEGIAFMSKGAETLDESNWANSCGVYDNLSPDICSNIVKKDDIRYYYKQSCVGSPRILETVDGSATDLSNVLHIKRVYSEDEKEGCFLFWCNGPWGNLHFVIMPYNKKLIALDKHQTAKNIKNAEDDAPRVVHTYLRGPYLSDNNHCEWYETDDVGFQDVYYNDNVVWDWDDFCIADGCPDKLMFSIWESDEGWWDDFVGYGIVKRDLTLKYDETFYVPEFKMAFMTDHWEWPETETDTPTSFGSIQGTLTPSDGQPYTPPSTAQQVLFYTDTALNPGKLTIVILLESTENNCTALSAELEATFSESLKLEVQLAKGEQFVGIYPESTYEALLRTGQGFFDIFDASGRWPASVVANPSWNISIETLSLPDPTSAISITPVIAGSFNIGLHDFGLIIDDITTGTYAGDVEGSFSSENYCGSLDE